MTVRPLHDWAVIRPSGAEEITAGGLFIPDSAKEKPYEGVVEAVGPGAYEEEKFGKKKDEKKERRFIPTVIKPGDRVLYERYAGKTYTINGEELVMVRERDILGILPERQPQQTPRPVPLQIPAATSGVGSTAMVKSGAPAKGTPAKKKAAAKTGKKIAKKKQVKAPKKVAKKAAKKAVKSVVKKAAGNKGKSASRTVKARTATAKKGKKKK